MPVALANITPSGSTASGRKSLAFWAAVGESAAATECVLRDIFPFSGQGYWDLDQLLTEEAPDVVDVCLPNEAHFDCVKCALERGCHVLCEKPLVWHSDGAEQTLIQARALVDLARQTNLHLGVCTQYAATLPYYRQLYEEARGSITTIESFYAEMETLARGRSPQCYRGVDRYGSPSFEHALGLDARWGY